VIAPSVGDGSCINTTTGESRTCDTTVGIFIRFHDTRAVKVENICKVSSKFASMILYGLRIICVEKILQIKLNKMLPPARKKQQTISKVVPTRPKIKYQKREQ